MTFQPFFCGVVLGLVLGAPALAHAQVPPEDRAAAEALFRDGRALATAGQMDAACTKFAESQRLEPMVGTLLYLATCHEEQGRTATAWVEFNEAAAMARKAGSKEREEQAVARAAAVELRLSKLVLQAPAGVSLQLDGRELRATDTALPVDPGLRTIRATAVGKAPWEKSVRVEAGPSELTVVVPALLPLPSVAPAAPAPPPAEAGAPLRTAGLVIGGVGIASLAVGAVFGAVAAGQRDDADAICDGRLCPQEGLDGHDAALRSAWVSTITIGVGAAALATGIVLVVWGGPSPDSTAASSAPLARVEVGARADRLLLRGSF